MGTERSVFISRPTILDEQFESAYEGFKAFAKPLGFNFRRLGDRDFSRKQPLPAVIELMKQCCGAIILGYPQTHFSVEAKRSKAIEKASFLFPTPWNHIEGALAFSGGVPVLVVAHKENKDVEIKGGVFDYGVTGETIIGVDLSLSGWFQRLEFAQPFQEWSEEVENLCKTKCKPSSRAPGRKKR